MGLMPNFDAMKVAKPDFFRALEVDGDTTKLNVRDKIVHVDLTTTGNITLPSVVEAAGETVAIYIAVDTAGTLTIQDKDDSFNWTDIDLDTVNESLVLYSDGLQWHVIGGTTVLIASVTANAAELNILDGAVMTTTELNSAADISALQELVTDDRVLTIADHNKTFTIATAAKKFTLPAAAAGTKGMIATFVNSGAAANNIITIESDTSDFIAGVITLASSVVVKDNTVNKDLINTAATSKTGDYVKLQCDGVDGWFILGSSGIWASEA